METSDAKKVDNKHVRTGSPPGKTSRPPWLCYDVQKNGITNVRKVPVPGPERAATDGSQLAGTNHVGNRCVDDRPTAYITLDQFVGFGPCTSAPMVLRSQVSEPSLSWTHRLPDRAVNGMPNPALDSAYSPKRKKMNLLIDTGAAVADNFVEPLLHLPVLDFCSPMAARVPSVTSPLSRSPGLTSPGTGRRNLASPTRGRGEIAQFGHQLLGRDLQHKPSTDLAGERVISREVSRERNGKLIPFTTVGAMDYHSRTAPLERQYTVPAIAADVSLAQYPFDDRYMRVSQRDSPTHKFHWRSPSSPNSRLWRGDQNPGSPLRSPNATMQDWQSRSRWHA